MDALARSIMLSQLGWDLDNLFTISGISVWEEVGSDTTAIRFVGWLDEN